LEPRSHNSSQISLCRLHISAKRVLRIGPIWRASRASQAIQSLLSRQQPHSREYSQSSILQAAQGGCVVIGLCHCLPRDKPVRQASAASLPTSEPASQPGRQAASQAAREQGVWLARMLAGAASGRLLSRLLQLPAKELGQPLTLTPISHFLPCLCAQPAGQTPALC